MKLYGSTISPFVRHCRIALTQEAHDFDYIDMDLEGIGKLSPTMKMPYFTDGDLSLSDSSSIVKYTREKSGNAFLPELQNFERYTLANTVMDTLINYRILAGEGFSPDSIQYMGRQLRRAESGLKALNDSVDPSADLRDDSMIRTACLLDWGLFRECINLDGLDNLSSLLDNAREVPEFSVTAPPR